MIPWSYQVLLVILVILAAGFDIRYRRIPNWLVFIGMLLGLAMNLFLFGWAGLQLSLIGVGLAFLIYFPMFVLRGMGAGDVKLMMAIGALVGPANWLAIFFFTGILGGLLAIGILLWRKHVGQTLFNVMYIVGELLRFRAPYTGNADMDVNSKHAMTMPHGATIAAGVAVFLARAVLAG
jgi:prepilin peptidase CpaA